ncbi:VWA domain-containing protein [Solibaculum mannosilyticum]|uniref:VWA domain-containing protein n=1 Tax=Solibaculum mannosilyticum TaxID=2780922 RepID=UPI0036F1ECBC
MLHLLKRICFSLCLIICFFLFTVQVQATPNDENLTKNVMLVFDNSGSIDNTDPEKLRIDATHLLLELLPENSNVGGLLFDDTIVTSLDINPISDEGLDSILGEIESKAPSGYTNLGMALEHAASSLAGKEDGVILLFSDGVTEMPDERSTAESIAARDRALAAASDHNIPIYTVALNANGEADLGELQAISDICMEIKTASDLQGAFSTLASILQGGDRRTDQVNLPYQGTFTIPSGGVKEANLVVITENIDDLSVTLTKPDASTYSTGELKDISTTGRYFVLYKITSPLQAGVWTYTIESSSNFNAVTNLIYNSSFRVHISDFDELHVNQDTELTAYLTDGSTRIFGKEYEVFFTVANASTGEKQELPAAQQSDGCYQATWRPAETGNYYVTATALLLKDAASDRSDTVEVSVVNAAPVVSQTTLQVTQWKGPFHPTTTLNLNEFVSDPEGETLTYSLEEVSGITLSRDGMLTLDGTDVDKFSIIIQDPAGNQVLLPISLRSFTTWFLIVPLILVFVAAAAVIFLIRKRTGMSALIWLSTEEKDRKQAYLSGHKMTLSQVLDQVDFKTPGEISGKLQFRPGKKKTICFNGKNLKPGIPVTEGPVTIELAESEDENGFDLDFFSEQDSDSEFDDYMDFD